MSLLSPYICIGKKYTLSEILFSTWGKPLYRILSYSILYFILGAKCL